MTQIYRYGVHYKTKHLECLLLLKVLCYVVFVTKKIDYLEIFSYIFYMGNIDNIQKRHELLKPITNERFRRLWGATEAKVLGHCVIGLVSKATHTFFWFKNSSNQCTT